MVLLTLLLHVLCVRGALAAPQRFEGRLAIEFRTGSATTIYRLVTAGRRTLNIVGFKADQQIPRWFYSGAFVEESTLVVRPCNPGARVAVVGELSTDKQSIMVSSAANVLDMRPSTSQGLLTQPLRRPMRILFINTNIQGQPPPLTNTDIEAALQAVNTRLSNCSYGLMGIAQETRVVGPIAINPITSCTNSTDMDIKMKQVNSQVWLLAL